MRRRTHFYYFSSRAAHAFYKSYPLQAARRLDEERAGLEEEGVSEGVPFTTAGCQAARRAVEICAGEIFLRLAFSSHLF